MKRPKTDVRVVQGCSIVSLLQRYGLRLSVIPFILIRRLQSFVWNKFSSRMMISPVILVVYAFAIILGSFCRPQALRKCVKVVADMG
jgi:hypothetical protein